MVILLVEIFFWILIVNTILCIIFQCTPTCKKFFESTNKPSFKTTGNLFGAHNKKVAKEITAVRPATCTSMQPEIIQPTESVRTQKEEEIAKGNVFAKKDNHPTFEDINDDWEPSIEDGTTTNATTKAGILFARFFKANCCRMAQVSLVPRNLKRSFEESNEIQACIKRSCHEGTIVSAKNGEHDVKRTSNLMAPNMLLVGHEAEIFTARFAATGDRLATAGFDRAILLWDVYGECKNISTLRGHKHSVMDLMFSTDTSCLASASADKTVRVWDMDTGKCYRNFVSHKDIVNSVSLSRRGNQLIASGSDDGRMLIHDFRQKLPCKEFLNNGKFQITAVAFNDSAEQVFCGGIDNEIHCWDLRKEKVLYSLQGHNDTITDIQLSPDGNYLLSNSMDICGTIWDVKPYCKENRAVSFYVGHQHNFEKNLLKCAWSPDARRISLGSSDGFHYIWNVQSSRVVYRLPGHQGSVNAVDFHPFEPIIVSAGSDKQVFLGEISTD